MNDIEKEIIQVLAKEPTTYNDISKNRKRNAFYAPHFYRLRELGIIEPVPEKPKNFWEMSSDGMSSDGMVLFSYPIKYQLAMTLDTIEKLFLL